MFVFQVHGARGASVGQLEGERARRFQMKKDGLAGYFYSQLDAMQKGFDQIQRQAEAFDSTRKDGPVRTMTGMFGAETSWGSFNAARRELDRAYSNLDKSIFALYGCKSQDGLAYAIGDFAKKFSDYVEKGHKYVAAYANTQPGTVDDVLSAAEFASLFAMGAVAGAAARGASAVAQGGKAALLQFFKTAAKGAGRAAAASTGISMAFSGAQVLSDQNYNAMLAQMQQNPKKAFEMLHASLVNARKAMETQGDANPAALSAIDAGISNVNRALQTAEFYGREFDWGSTAKMFIETFAVCLAFDMAFRGASGKPGGAGATRNKQDAAKKSAPPHRGTAARQDTDAPGGYANAIQPGTARQAKNIGTDAPETPKAGIKTPALKYPRASHEYALGDAFSRCAEFYELGKGHYEKEFARLLRTEFPQTYEFLCQTARNCGFEPNDKSISGLASEMLFAADDGIALDAMAAQLPRTPRYHDITLEVLAQETRIEMAPSAIRFAGADMTNTFKKTLSDMGLSWNDENVSALNRMWQAQVFEDVPLAKSIEDFSRAKGRGRVFSLPEYVEEGYFRKFVLSWHEKKGGVPGAFGGN